MENPAVKLQDILENAYNKVNENHSYTDAWAIVFNIDANDNIALMQNISGMINLYNDTLNLVKKNEKLNNERNLKYLNSIGKALYSINFSGKMHHFFANISRETLTCLSFIGEIIGYNYELTESKVDNEKVAQLINEINELIGSIYESTLPSDVQDILIKNLLNIQDALHKYRFLGEDELRKALEQTVGSIAINKSIIDIHQDDVIYPRFGNIIGNVSSLITIGTAIKDYLLPYFDKLPFK